MSGVAVMGGGEATIGLVPRYLRGRDTDGGSQTETNEAVSDDVRRDPFADADMPVLPRLQGASMTEELRRRIAEAAVPERHGRRPLWIGLAAVGVLLLVGIAFPDTVLGMLPSLDATP